MDLQQQILNKIGVDKLLHNSYGGWITALAFPFFGLWEAFLIGSIIAVLKEVFDRYIRKTKFDWYDILATESGCMISSLVILIMSLIL